MNKDLVDRAAAAGYRVLMVTVDTIVTGNRTRDRRNGLLIPPELTVQTLASIAAKPGYWVRMLRSDPIEFANFAGQRGFTIHRTGDLFNPAASWDDIAMLRDRWPGKLMLKGPHLAVGRPPRGLARGRRPAAVQPRRTPARPGDSACRPDRSGSRGGRTRDVARGGLGRPARI